MAQSTLPAPPTFADLLAARERIRPHLAVSPLRRYAVLDDFLKARVHVKHENELPTRAFKVRGGINAVARLAEAERRKGLLAVSTGNHGQSVAYAGRLFGVAATIVVPENANPVKVNAMRKWGAQLVFYGKTFDHARAHCEELASRKGMRYISSGDEPDLIAGVGTHTLEILEEQPDVDTVIVPVGGGSGAAGACLAAKGLNPNVRVLAVQASAASSAYQTWKHRKATPAPMETTAEGLATGAPFMLPQKILWEHLHDFVLVSDDEMANAVRFYHRETGTTVEYAGAASLAAAFKLKKDLAGRCVALILSGGNIDPQKLARCVS